MHGKDERGWEGAAAGGGVNSDSARRYLAPRPAVTAICLARVHPVNPVDRFVVFFADPLPSSFFLSSYVRLPWPGTSLFLARNDDNDDTRMIGSAFVGDNRATVSLFPPSPSSPPAGAGGGGGKGATKSLHGAGTR